VERQCSRSPTLFASPEMAARSGRVRLGFRRRVTAALRVTCLQKANRNGCCSPPHSPRRRTRLLSICVGLFFARFGTPLLLVFLAIGLLFGKEGPVGLVFHDFEAAYLIGSVALAVILFEGGLKTKRNMLKIALWLALALATAGVAVTAGVVGVAFALLPPPPLPYSPWVIALLVGAILVPTDAAAVATLLRRAGLALPERITRARGMWMGGKVPLGYDVVSRKLIVNEDEAPRVRRLFEIFAETGSGIETVNRLRAEGVTSKAGRPLDKGDVYKLLNDRTYVGEAAHKGQVYPGEHQGIVPRELWDQVHAVLQVSPRVRANQNRAQTPALLTGLIFGVDGRALSPTHARKNGRLYRYYVAQRVLKGDAAGDGGIVRRISAAEIETAVVDQVRALLRQPEVVVGTWRVARKDAPDLTEGETQDALHRLDPLWNELFPAEQARIVRALVERVAVGPAGADVRLRVEGLAGLVRDLTAIAPDALKAAA
jgi:hypothetical protein